MSGEDATITLLLTDIEGSTKLWEQDPRRMAVMLERHDALVRRIVEAHGGTVVKARGEGDSVFAMFATPSDAATAAVEIQQELGAAAETKGIAVRMAVHSGEAAMREGDYYGPTVNRCARIREIAHGGQILLSEAAFALCGGKLPGAPPVRDQGRHRLRDLTQPERLYEILVPGCRQEFPPLRSLEAGRHNLPIQPTTFVGRASDIASAKDLLGVARLVSLVGVGGCGKTRLALQVAAELVDVFEGGAWFVDLSTAAHGGVQDALLSVLGLQPTPGGDALERLLEHLQGRRRLLVLDNCERVLDDVAQIVGALVAQAPGVAILTTSREPLLLSFEHIQRVPPLSVPDPGESSLEHVRATESAQMFEDRAALRETGFRIDLANVRHVASICRRLDGLPLALELAAAQIDVLSPGQLDDRLARAMLDVRGDTRGETPRHETMRAAIAWSYEGLDDEEKRVFTGLGVFTGGFALEAVEGVLGAGAYERLRSLVRKSLVIVEESAGGKRFRLLETIRSFAVAQTSEGRDRDAENHARWFRDLVVQAADELVGPRQAEWMHRLSGDYENIRAALIWCQSAAPTDLARMCDALGRFWVRQGMMREARSWLERAVLVDVASEPVLAAKLVELLGVFCWSLRDYAEAEKHLQDAFDHFVALGETAEAAGARTNQGNLAGDCDRPELAMTCQAESVALYESIGDLSGAARARFNLGVTLIRLNRYDEATAVLTQAMAVLDAAHDYARLANLKINLAGVRAKQHDPAGARSLVLDAFDLLRDTPSSSFVGCGLLVAAWTAMEAGDLCAAARLIGSAEAEFEHSEDKMTDAEIADSETVLAAVSTALGRDECNRLLSEGRATSTMQAIDHFRSMTGITTG